jgi:hypothetical protein
MSSADQTLSAHLPAPKTFAPSREDVLSTLAFFFGDPAVPEKLKGAALHNLTMDAPLDLLTSATLLRARLFGASRNECAVRKWMLA